MRIKQFTVPINKSLILKLNKKFFKGNPTFDVIYNTYSDLKDGEFLIFKIRKDMPGFSEPIIEMDRGAIVKNIKEKT